MRDKYSKTLLFAPAILVLVATVIYPFVRALILSFRDWRLSKSSTPGPFIGFENYARAFGDPHFLNSVIVTILYTILSVSMSIVLGMVMALLLNRRGRFHTFLRTTLILPFAVSPVLKGYSWRFMLNPRLGILSKMIGIVFPPLADFVWLGKPGWALFWLAVTEIWGWAPFIALVFIGGLRSMSSEVIDAAKVDGASPVQAFLHVTLPILKPLILITTLLKIIFSLKMFDQVVTMTGGGPGRATETLNYYIYKNGFKFYDMGYASALAYILIVVLVILSFFYVKTLLREEV